RDRIATEQQARTRWLLSAILSAGLALNVATAMGLAAIFTSDVVRRLAGLSDNTRRFAEQLPLNAMLPGSDEISLLDVDFRTTADRIAEQRARERAFFDHARSI